MVFSGLGALITEDVLDEAELLQRLPLGAHRRACRITSRSRVPGAQTVGSSVHCSQFCVVELRGMGVVDGAGAAAARKPVAFDLGALAEDHGCSAAEGNGAPHARLGPHMRLGQRGGVGRL